MREMAWQDVDSSFGGFAATTAMSSRCRLGPGDLPLNFHPAIAAMTAQLVTDALVMAIWRRGKPDALLHHSDRGSQYTSEQFQRLMADSGVVCSMSRSGNVWDNAAMESIFSSLKTERTSNKTYRTRNEAKADVFDYIERFYNSKRRHSTIGYLSPIEFERQAGFA